MKYLKNKQQYIDSYDLYTINECLEKIDLVRKIYKESENQKEQFTKAERAKGSNWFCNQFLELTKAERYSRKEKTIQEWIAEDRKKQDKYENTPLPKNIKCTVCNVAMKCTLKHLDITEDPLKMQFFYTCPSCKKKKCINEDGSERKSAPQLCPKCKSEITFKTVKESKDKITWLTSCPSCGFEETSTENLKEIRQRLAKKKKSNKKLLNTYREAFCSDEAGKSSFEYIEAQKVAAMVYDEELQKYDSNAYHDVSKINKITILELEKKVAKALKETNFTGLSFDKPVVERYVKIPFQVFDTNSSSNREKSISKINKLIKDALVDTNWRLIKESISYRLGYLSGELKGYENEEDFFKLMGKKKEPNAPVFDEENRIKYESHNVVQLARLSGKYKGIRNVRERRLKQEPEGFFLGNSEDSYTCGICRESMSGDKTWWTLDGIRCSDCQLNISKGVIPKGIMKDDDTYIKDFQLKSDFNVHPSTVRKLRRQGILNGRDLKRENGTVYCTLYLLDENKEFLKKYPKNPRHGQLITDLLGEKIEL